MLSHIGKGARKFYKTLSWKEDGDEKKFKKVLEAFEEFCSPQRNVMRATWILAAESARG